MAQTVSTFKLYVGNLPDGATNELVANMFQKYGRVVELEIFERRFAFVHMEDDEAGMTAIRDLDGTVHNGSKIMVNHQTGEGPRLPTMKLAVSNLPASVSPRKLRAMFLSFGYVVEASVYRGGGHVLLEATGDIRSAISNINGTEIDGKMLKVEAMPLHQQHPVAVAPAPAQFETPSTYGTRYPPAQMPQMPNNHGYRLRPPGPNMLRPRYGPSRPSYGPPQGNFGPGPRPLLRPPPPPVDFSEDLDYGETYDSGPPPPPYYGPPRMQPYRGYSTVDGPSYNNAPPPPGPMHRPPRPLMLSESPCDRIPRNRYGYNTVSEGPKPLFDHDPRYASFGKQGGRPKRGVGFQGKNGKPKGKAPKVHVPLLPKMMEPIAGIVRPAGTGPAIPNKKKKKGPPGIHNQGPQTPLLALYHQQKHGQQPQQSTSSTSIQSMYNTDTVAPAVDNVDFSDDVMF